MTDNGPGWRQGCTAAFANFQNENGTELEVLKPSIPPPPEGTRGRVCGGGEGI